MKMKIYIKGVNISFVLPTLELEKIVARYSVEDQYLTGLGGKDISLEEIIEQRYNSLIEKLKRNEFIRFIIVLNKTKEIIGSISLDINIYNKFGGVGIYLLKEFRGKGYGTESLKLICFVGFIIFGLRKITASIFSSNLPSLKCFKKVGFKEVGRFRKHIWHFGKYENLILMELFKEEFLESEKDFVKEILKLNNIPIERVYSNDNE